MPGKHKTPTSTPLRMLNMFSYDTGIKPLISSSVQPVVSAALPDPGHADLHDMIYAQLDMLDGYLLVLELSHLQTLSSLA